MPIALAVTLVGVLAGEPDGTAGLLAWVFGRLGVQTAGAGSNRGGFIVATDTRSRQDGNVLLMGADLRWDMLGGALTHVFKVSRNVTERNDLTLADFGFPPRVYPIGRLDADSEGLLLLSDEPELNQRLLHPRNAHAREYWVQVERIPSVAALRQLEEGLLIQGHRTRPCRARLLEPQPQLPPRDPPIRERKSVPDCWLSLELIEGKNRQVRRMTAAIGHPTLRLVRVRIGGLFRQGKIEVRQ